MGEWIKDNPILSSILNFALAIIIALFFAKIYIDYKTNNELGKLRQQLNEISEGQNTVIEIVNNFVEKYKNE